MDKCSLLEGYTKIYELNLLRKSKKMSLLLCLASNFVLGILLLLGQHYVSLVGAPHMLFVFRRISGMFQSRTLDQTIALVLVYLLIITISMVAGGVLCRLLRSLMINKYAKARASYVLKKRNFQVGSETYFNKHQYMIIMITPIIISTILLSLIIIFSPRAWFWGVFFLLLGVIDRVIIDDLYKIYLLRNVSPKTLIKDKGFVMVAYSPTHDESLDIKTSNVMMGMAFALCIVVCAFFIAVSMVRNLRVLYSTHLPPWDTIEFRNNKLPPYKDDGAITTNGALRRSLHAFNNAHVRDNYNIFAWTQLLVPTIPDRHGQQRQDAFIYAFTRGWEDDYLSYIMPFNTIYLRSVLEPIAMYFTPNNYFDLALWSGFYSRDRRLNLNHMFIGLWDSRLWVVTEQPRIPIHEVGHALGLEVLTELFAREFMLPYVALMDDSDRHHYDISFDMTLQEIAGCEAFWKAAFTSNAAYGELWDIYLGAIISFNDMMLARGAMRRINLGLIRGISSGDTGLLQTYQNATGNHHHDMLFFENIPSRFLMAFGDAQTSTSDDDEELLAALHDIADIARVHNVPPVIAVNDNVIYGYEARILYISVIVLVAAIACFSLYIFIRNAIILHNEVKRKKSAFM